MLTGRYKFLLGRGAHFLVITGLLAVVFRIPPAPRSDGAAQAPELTPRIFLPLVPDKPPPPYTTSHYMKTVDSWTLSVMGCQVGIRDAELSGRQDSLLFLDFGSPWVELNGPGEEDDLYGVYLFSGGTVPTSDLAGAVQNFAWGYYSCLGEDRDSHLTIAVGTNNWQGGDVTPDHGRAWALMVNDINQWLIDNGYFAQVGVGGGGDIEVGWNTPEKSRAWVDGYDSANAWPLYFFGDAAGCPPSGSCGTSSFPSWTQEDVWYVSWGAPPSVPLPLIYANSGIHARQWYQLSLYGYNNQDGRMNFGGAVTQYQACQQRPSSLCQLLDNTPPEGWSQLWETLNVDARTAQELLWSTDFRWYGE